MDTKTESQRTLAFLLSEANGKRSRQTVTIISGAGVLAAGTVLGKITASGKYTSSPATGADGSESAIAVLSHEVDASAADVAAVVIARDAEVKTPELAYAASVDDSNKRAAKATQLATVGIIVR